MFPIKHSKSPSKNPVCLRWGRDYLVYVTQNLLTQGLFSFKDPLSPLIYGAFKAEISIDNFIVLIFIKLQVNK